jgi:hypothetical protein
MGKDAWALRKFRYNDPQRKVVRKENLRQERDGFWNPPRREGDDGENRGFGM